MVPDARKINMNRLLLISLALMATACASDAQPPASASPSFAVLITGYEVPKPTSVPFADETDQREYLRFYHQGYLTTMHDDHFGHSSISPISDRPQAAMEGHYAGQTDAHRDKTAYWAARGREFGLVVQP